MRQKKDPERWTYLTAAVEKYALSRPRLLKAIEDGLITTQEVKNPHYRSGPKALLINRPQLLRHLERVKLTPRELELKSKRSLQSKVKAEERKVKLLAWVDGLNLVVQRRPLKVLIEEACQHYNSLWTERERYEKHASPDDDPHFLARIAVNMLRHEETDYERALEDTYGKVGVEEAMERLRVRIFKAIAKVYPELHHECQRQAGVTFPVERTQKETVQLTLYETLDLSLLK